MELHFKGNSRIFLLAFFGLLMVTSSYLIFFFNPLKLFGDKAVLLSKNSISYGIFKNPPYEIYLKMYLFNITNAEEFMSGEDSKLKFEEIGPYVYLESLVNENTTFHDNGTLSYSPKRTLKFLPEMSVGDPTTDFVNVPNVPLLGIASMLHQSSMFLNLAVLSITRMLNSQPILNLTVYDYFWGYEDKLVHMASSVLPNWISFQKFGIIDRMYDDGNQVFTINVDPNNKIGSLSIDEQERGRLYSIMTVDGNPGMSQWGYEPPINNETVEGNSQCNMVEGAYDGVIFPPNLQEDMTFRVYRKFVCRTMPIRLEKKGVSEDNFNVFYYKVFDNFLAKREDNPDNDCYCKDKNFCLPAGLGDATPCYYGFPAAISLPHMLNVDPSVYEKIEGMAPDEEKHASSLMVNQEVGLVMRGYSRMQVNLVMWQTKYNSRTAPFNNMVLPLFWSEMSVKEIPPSVHLLLTLLLKVGPVCQITIMYILAIVGASLIASAGILVFLSMSPAVDQRSPSINLGYTPIRIIPVIRRESWIRDIRRMNRQNSLMS